MLNAAPRLRQRAGAIGLAGLLAASLATTVAQAKVLAKVDGMEITDADVAIAADDVGSQLPPQLQGAARDKALVDNLIVTDLVAKKAEAQKVQDTPEFKQKLDYLRRKLLAETYLAQIAKAADTPDAVQKTYDEVSKAQKPEEEVHARHILVPTEDEAKKALARIKGGEDFAKVAKEISKDPGAKGGDLGWFTKDRMVPEFAAAAFKLQPGQVSDPVKTQFGWHIIKVEGKRMKEFPKLDQIRSQISRYLMQKAESQEIVKLRDAAKIERFDAPAKDDKTKDADKK
ncbi:MAG: peptidylprolyl isomerase [Methylobacteriaceae bacterium]|nr:peptidylprolyl isomerase [Methylobacteriaceae bacterium]